MTTDFTFFKLLNLQLRKESFFVKDHLQGGRYRKLRIKHQSRRAKTAGQLGRLIGRQAVICALSGAVRCRYAP